MQDARDTGRARAIPTTNRRDLLAGASAALVVGAAIAVQAKGATTEPDAELIRLLALLHQQTAAVAAIEEEGHHLPPGITDASRDQERRLDAAVDAREATWERIIAMPASTPAGMQPKAEALGMLVFFYAYTEPGDTLEDVAKHGDTPDRIALSLARDVLAWRAQA